MLATTILFFLTVVSLQKIERLVREANNALRWTGEQKEKSNSIGAEALPLFVNKWTEKLDPLNDRGLPASLEHLEISAVSEVGKVLIATLEFDGRKKRDGLGKAEALIAADLEKAGGGFWGALESMLTDEKLQLIIPPNWCLPAPVPPLPVAGERLPDILEGRLFCPLYTRQRRGWE
uniref:Uncharacterized protein n=1 Tax=Chromera velia CCMP2878 TaxID=1169474 RepID=A0A0G4G1D3_9ALVE|eukprot:Cvel_19609.t1-p1 / transcript=Cvel_19609.t1 / gene=Cvel_19609 / organism=Chromera_velia_CCMP2878 / gene_product=hypothetical protein / transcript_product=hypothetical protein / location=Cvel_scaffold1705:10092-10982(+) / protein_length=176 / sequence_SO=supercontig / SO=protein_coding / is_pseudo=false